MDRPPMPQDFPDCSVVFPVMTKERFASLSGLTEGTVQGMIEKGHLPSVKIGRHRLVNVAALTLECRRRGDDAGFPSTH